MGPRKGRDLRQQGLMPRTTARLVMYGRGRTGFKSDDGLQTFVGNDIKQLERRTRWTGFALFHLRTVEAEVCR